MNAYSVKVKRSLALAVGTLACLSVFAAPPPPPVYVPEILVTGQSAAIEFGSTQPRKLDGTYFGAAQLGVNSWEHTFEIRNFGHADLQVTVPLTITGPNASDFTITQQPNTVVSPEQRTSFNIRYTPSFIGNAYATVNVLSNDVTEGHYTFDIRGDGVSTALTGPDLQGDLVLYKKYKCKGIPLLFCKMNGRVEVKNLSQNYDLSLASVRIYVVPTDVLYEDKFLLDEIPVKNLKRWAAGKPLKTKKIKFKGWVPPGYTHIYAEVVPQDGSEDIDYTNNRTAHLYGI